MRACNLGNGEVRVSVDSTGSLRVVGADSFEQLIPLAQARIATYMKKIRVLELTVKVAEENIAWNKAHPDSPQRQP